MKRRVLSLSLALLALPTVALAQDKAEPDPGYEAPPLPPKPAPRPLEVVVTPSSAETPPASEATQPRVEGPPRYDFIRVNGGFKMGYVGDRAFDAFSSTDVLPQLSLDGTYTLVTIGRLALAAGAGWDVGGSHAKLRGNDAYLTTHRLYVPVEARVHFRSFYLFGKVAPGAAAMAGWIKDASAPSGEVSRTGWAFSTDASAGASFLLGPRSDLDKRGVRIWATPEMGYAFTGGAPMRLDPGRDTEDQLGADQGTRVGSLALSGLFWRASIGFSY